MNNWNDEWMQLPPESAPFPDSLLFILKFADGSEHLLRLENHTNRRGMGCFRVPEQFMAHGDIIEILEVYG